MNPEDGSEELSPRGEGSRGSLVPLALALYATMGAVAVVWRLLSDGQIPFLAARGAAPDGSQLLGHALLGLLAGGGMVGVSRLWTRYSRMGRALAQQLAALLGPQTGISVVVLALASGLGEEVFFRGALQPRVGLLLASLLFALAHLVPRRDLVPWAGFALLAGLILGALFDYTGNLLAPAIAHVLVNGVNLRWLSRASARGDGLAPPGS